ncbi:bifunctional diguanylate cyclase/phosphodiesterase [uncultured Tateyamaria sp.]|uniref:putative bifunctional diguanylate cyclase/phosphodiesterase n=1 Tax=uncultured Tateyamaria sp. TaxID=455651 RepID=UPI002622D384|nr:bifunctional diguanylate cyclase/phosphodiesterase [uncultured Tateyamaria sp.]
MQATDKIYKVIENDTIVSRSSEDGLTGLARYRGFTDECLKQQFANELKGPALFLFIDADNLKRTNDLLGHSVGDGLILAIASELRRALPRNAIVGRKGGDEFIAIVPCQHMMDAQRIAEFLFSQLQGCCKVAGHTVMLSCSVGASFIEPGSVEFDLHEKRADTAMYWAKSNGKNQLKFYSEEDCRDIAIINTLSLEFSDALRAGDLDCYFQPIFRLEDKRIIGAEALIRWHHDQYGSVKADKIIEIASKSGALPAVGEYVLRRACGVAKCWPADTFVCVNFSSADFYQTNFSDLVLEILREQGFCPRRLRIEITESEFLDMNAEVGNNIASLRKHGVMIGIDDFGTGHASMGSVDSFPGDFLKIDRSLIASCQDRDTSRVFIRAIKTVSDKLGFQVIAEGVETLNEAAMVRGCGILFGQGFYFCKPVPAPEFEQLVHRDEESIVGQRQVCFP